MADDTIARMSDHESGEIPQSESAESEPILQACPGCSGLLDVSEEEPFAKVHCPMCGTQMHARTQLKNFTLQEQIGGGGMGTVYRALDTNLNRLVALKVVRREFSSDETYLTQFEKEARITASINHPHVVEVFSVVRITASSMSLWNWSTAAVSTIGSKTKSIFRKYACSRSGCK